MLERWRAERRVILREDPWASKWMTGGVLGLVSSALLVAILIPALAWHALTMPSNVAGILCALANASGALFLAIRAFLMRHLMPPFDRVFASGPSTWFIGLPFAFILFYATWHAADIPMSMSSAHFSEALSIDLHTLPEAQRLANPGTAAGVNF